VATKSKPIRSCTVCRRAADAKKSKKNPTFSEAAALARGPDVTYRPRCQLTVARADLLTTRTLRAKVPADSPTTWAGAGNTRFCCGVSTSAAASGRAPGASVDAFSTGCRASATGACLATRCRASATTVAGCPAATAS
jgi:hypothetical protein